MRWILCGKNDAAVSCLELLLRQGDEVWAIVTAGDDGCDGWQRSLRCACERRQVAFEQPRRINSPAFVERLAAFDATALISIQYDQILRRNFLRTVGCPCLNLHFAVLPRHRGVAPIAWAILAGDSQAGVTLHHMIEDVDAGDVIAQRAVPIAPETTARELYDGLSVAAVELFAECYPFPRELLGRRLPQDPAEASYHRAGELDFSRRGIDWDRPAAGLHAWLRAMIFPPLQYPETRAGSRRLSVTRVGGALGKAVTAAPGVVVGRSSSGIEVAARDRSIHVCGLADPTAPEQGSEALLRSIAPGEKLTSGPSRAPG